MSFLKGLTKALRGETQIAKTLGPSIARDRLKLRTGAKYIDIGTPPEVNVSGYVKGQKPGPNA